MSEFTIVPSDFPQGLVGVQYLLWGIFYPPQPLSAQPKVQTEYD